MNIISLKLCSTCVLVLICIHVLQSAITRPNPESRVPSLKPGEAVEFQIKNCDKGREAANVTGVNGACVVGAQMNRNNVRRGGRNRGGNRSKSLVKDNTKLADNKEIKENNDRNAITSRIYRAKTDRERKGFSTLGHWASMKNLLHPSSSDERNRRTGRRSPSLENRKRRSSRGRKSFSATGSDWRLERRGQF